MEEFLADEEIKNVYDKINDVERVALHKGEKKGIIKTAKNLLQLNIAIEDVSKATGLSIQEETILFYWILYTFLTEILNYFEFECLKIT